jgi:hypothetical protein
VLLENPESIAIAGTRVALHEHPDAASPIVARLDYDVVGYGPDGPTDEWGGWRRDTPIVRASRDSSSARSTASGS